MRYENWIVSSIVSLSAFGAGASSIIGCGSSDTGVNPAAPDNGTGGGGPLGGAGQAGGAAGAFGSAGGFGGVRGVNGFGGAGNIGGFGGAGNIGGSAGANNPGGSGAGGAVTSNTGGQAGSLGAGGTAPTPHGNVTCLQAGTGDYAKAGPYAVSTKAVDLASVLPAGTAAPTTFMIFYPTKLEASCPHPIASWGNGTTVTGSNVYAFFQNNAASWGVVVIASDNPSVGSGAYNKAGIDYLLAQNNDPASEFFHRLSTRAGVAGHSQGAIGATAATTHPNVEAEVQVEGGGRPKAGMAFLALSGTADTTVGTGPPTQSYTSATGPAFLAIYTGADHVTTPTLAGWSQKNPGTVQFMRLYTAWYRCFLADDGAACAMFKGGANCGMCTDPNWDKLQSKNM
jgi:hypothetical protein